VALVFALVGFRLGLNNRDSGVIDVGYAGVVGASRLIDGVLPYGHFPVAQGHPCGGRYADGTPVGYVQSNGRCETAIANGDTYGPAVYLAYVPAVAVFGWSGRWDSLPAAHVAACAFDVLAVLGLFVAGWRLADIRIGVLAAFAWAADPFTLYSLNMNSNDALVGALVAWTLAALAMPRVRGMLLAAAGLSKAAPLAMVPVFWRLRHRRRTAAGFALGAALMLAMLILQPSDWRLLWERTIGYQEGRVTPMSVWTLGDFHPGWIHLESAQRVLQVVVVAGVALLALVPRGGRDAAAVAALSGAAMIATQVVSSYWFFPYICWWLPAVVLGLLLPREGRYSAVSERAGVMLPT
ncbi:MAG TPA: glycosyltransferase 87 family protein, partial [Gaiellales bacterium]|nr:glycosyltransferase 87 family protein [Gaiellales bacterium]